MFLNKNLLLSEEVEWRLRNWGTIVSVCLASDPAIYISGNGVAFSAPVPLTDYGLPCQYMHSNDPQAELVLAKMIALSGVEG